MSCRHVANVLALRYVACGCVGVLRNSIMCTFIHVREDGYSRLTLDACACDGGRPRPRPRPLSPLRFRFPLFTGLESDLSESSSPDDVAWLDLTCSSSGDSADSSRSPSRLNKQTKTNNKKSEHEVYGCARARVRCEVRQKPCERAHRHITIRR
jgi:hypothetical protein